MWEERDAEFLPAANIDCEQLGHLPLHQCYRNQSPHSSGEASDVSTAKLSLGSVYTVDSLCHILNSKLNTTLLAKMLYVKVL